MLEKIQNGRLQVSHTLTKHEHVVSETAANGPGEWSMAPTSKTLTSVRCAAQGTSVGIPGSAI